MVESIRAMMSVMSVMSLSILGLLLLFSDAINCNEFEYQPKMQNNNGVLILEAVRDKNITFRLTSRDSAFLVDELNVLDVLRQKFPSAASQVANAASETAVPTVNALIDEMRSMKSDLQRVNFRFSSLRNRTLRNFEIRHIRRYLGRILRLVTRITQIENNLNLNECESSPTAVVTTASGGGATSTICKNGGTCYDSYKDFYCDCPVGWEGKTCEDDVDECYLLAGTALGCQNGGTCVNTRGSYSCICRSGFAGTHCLIRNATCDTSQSKELCGNGICIPANNERSYTCICDQGWSTDEINRACTVDVNECNMTTNPCHSECINLPGSFKCGACPRGYTGDGVACYDVNECAMNNGGCSMLPKVSCINTEGSYHCGNCPPGWMGDGHNCEKTPSNSCDSENICHPKAKCEYVSEAAVCTCPNGMYGHGFGSNGCTLAVSDPCDNHQCKNNATCIITGRGTRCICSVGYTGPTCEQTDACHQNPCRNGGTCSLLPSNDNKKYRCSCPRGTTGDNCEILREICGSVIRQGSGELSYPSDGNSYAANERCAWIIRSTDNTILNITFSEFDLEDTVECNKDWLQIHDGRSLAAQMIGRFCGKSLPRNGNIISSQQQMFFWFRSDNATNGSGFKMSWFSQEYVCGGSIDVYERDYGVIRSPGYPGKAASNRDCEWRLNAPFRYRMVLRFYEITLGGDKNCSRDSIKIFDSDLMLKSICESSSPEPFHTSSNQALIHFHTDATAADSSFQLHYEVLPAAPHCGGVYSEPTGIISGYMNSELCLYLIQQPVGTKIKLEFTIIDFLRSPYCTQQRIEIYDGKSDEDPLLQRLCSEEDISEPIISKGNFMLLRYEYLLYGLKLLKKFEVRYSRVCEESFFGPEGGIFATPNYPNAYFEDMTCTFNIYGPQASRIHVNFTDFSISESTTMLAIDEDTPGTSNKSALSDDFYNYVDVYLSNTNKRRYYKGAPMHLVSEKNRMRIVFHGNANSEKRRGIRVEYYFEDVECGGVLTRAQGSFSKTLVSTVPMYCEWIIEAPEGKHINLNLTYRRVGGSENRFDCATGVSIYANDSITGEKLLDTFCNEEHNVNEPFNTNVLTIISKMDSRSQTGFTIYVLEGSYSIVDSKNECGGNLSSRFGVIKSPGWPKRYQPSMDCTWIISAPLGHKIELLVRNFSLETTSDNCLDDALEIRNGKFNESPLIGKYCGTKIPTRIPSFANQLYLHFTSDDFLSDDGFYISWQQTETGCGGKLNSHKGSIHSPHNWDASAGIISCDWQIAVSQSSRIDLSIMQLEEVSDLCTSNAFAVYDGPTTESQQLILNCSSADNDLHGTFKLQASSNQVLIRYSWEENGQDGLGFLIDYESNCNVQIGNLKGVIESPNFPDNYPPGMDCTWDLRGGRNNKFSLAFSHLEIENRDSTCDFDYVEVIDMRNDIVLSTQHLCSVPPEPLISEGNRLLVKFVSDYSTHANGFRAEYKRLGCGEYLTKEVGSFGSPNSPYSIDLDCDWYIEVPAGKQIFLHLTEVHIESDKSDCSADGIIVKEDKNSAVTLLKECQIVQIPTTVTAPANRLYIHFFASGTHSRKYFKATYAIRNAQCGGVYRGNTGLITSPNYPNRFATNMECIWYITVEDSYGITFEFEHFNLTAKANCTDTFLELNRIEKMEQHLLQRSCGETKPNVKNTIGNQLNVIFKVASDGLGKFAMRYQKQCGGNILQPSGFMKSVSNEDCVWVISSSEGSHVTLNIFRLECQCRNATNCTSGLWLFNANDDSELGYFCGKHPANIVAPAHNLRIRATNVNFRAKYSSIESSCGGTLTSLAGFLATPHYPNAYPPNIECIWQIEGKHGNGIELNFEELNITRSEHCNADFLEIRQMSERGPILGLYCSNTMPEDTLVAFENVWIKFRSADGDGGGGNGFKLSWNFAHTNELNGTGGSIEAPPVYAVNDNEPYTWRIMVQRGKLIILNFMEYSKGLNLYDGFDENAIKIEIIYSPWSFVSSSNVLYLTTINDELDNFKIVWSTTNTTTDGGPIAQKDKCYKELVLSYMDRTNISSPGYPFGYAKNLRCEWLVKPKDPAEHIVFSLYEAKLENYNTCSIDFLRVLGSSNLQDWHQELKICDSYDMTPTPINVIHGMPFIKLEFNSDSSINGSGFTSLARSACGSNMTGPIGRILGYNILHSRLVNSTCLWHIKVKPSNRILFNFEFGADYVVPKSEECRQYAVIYDGLDDNAPILPPGRICNQENRNIKRIESTTNQVVLKYSINFTDTLFSVRERLWNLTYREFSDCGGEIRLTEYSNAINVSSPRYPNVPHPHTECNWVIIAPAGETIQAEFIERFDMNLRYCSREYVELFDGSTANARSLGRYCTKPINTLTSTGNVLSLHYLTDIAEPRNGFIATLRISKCGGTFTKFTDVITSENYPALGAYPRSTVCEYIIKMPPHSTILLNFTNIDLPFNETNMHSGSDRLEIIATGANPGDSAILYGNVSESVLELDTNEVWIRFVTKRGGVKYRGFQLRYLRSFGTCFRDFTGTSGVLSVNNLRSTNSYTSCRWKITVPKGQRVTFEFLKMEGETMANNTERFLTVLSRRPTQTVINTFTFFNDHELVSRITDFSYENYNSSAIIRSTDNYMFVRINLVRDTFTIRKIRARYSSDEEAPCPPDIGTSSNGIIALDALRSYGSFYCQLKFQLSGVETITFKINTLQTIRNESLARPYAVRIRDEQIFTPFRVMYGNVSNELVSLSPKRGSVSLLQNDNVKIVRFFANYKRNPCGGLLKLEDGIAISFPGDSINYSSQLECVWTLNGGYRGNSYMLRGNVSLSDTCEREYLVIYAGNTVDYPELARMCRDSPSFNDTLLKKQFTMIVYHTESYKPYGSNFNLKGEKTVACGSKIDIKWSIDPIIMSSKSYKNNMECNWEFEADAGLYISLYFTGRFFIEDSVNCTNDYLEVLRYDGGLWVPESRFCGREVPDIFNVTSNRIQVVFRTNEAITGDGFTFKAGHNCIASFNVTNQIQTIRTPFIEYARYSQTHCEYKFQSESEALINVRILNKTYRRFGLPAHRTGCEFSSFVVYKRDIFGAMVKSGKYCDDTELSSRKYLQLNYDSVFDSNFEIEYGLNACGGNITASPGIIRSLQNEDRVFYVENMNCVWNIIAPPDHSIILRFKYLDMEHNIQCNYDYVSIYEGPLISDGKRLAKLCGNLTSQPPTIMVDNNQAVIAAASDASNAAKGFFANVIFTPNCNERIGLTDGNSPITLTRSFHLNSSAENYLCYYRVTAPEDYRVNVQLKNLQLNASDCRSNECKNCNYLEILNSIGVMRASIGRYCKNGRSDVKVISAYEDILLILNLARAGQYSFEIVLEMEQSVCGGRNEIELKDNEVTTVVFPPNGEALYQPNTHCMWRIKSNKEFEIQFNYLLLQNVSQVSGKCLDYVHIKGHHITKYFCGNATGYRVYLSKLQNAFAEISFHSDETMESKGFSLTAMPQHLCNRTYNGMSDLLAYRNYEGGTQRCIDEIRVPENYTISLFIPHLTFDYGNCSTKFLKIVDLNSNKTILDRCDNSYIDTNLFTQTNALRLHATAFINIRIFYTSSSKFLPPGCGGEIYSTEGQISNAPYTVDRKPLECRWDLVVPAPNKMRINFFSFNMGSKTNCALDYMHIMEIQPNGSEKLVKNLCGDDVPNAFVTGSNHIAIISKKSPNFDGTGWTITFELEYDLSNYNQPEYIYNGYGRDGS